MQLFPIKAKIEQPYQRWITTRSSYESPVLLHGFWPDSSALGVIWQRGRLGAWGPLIDGVNDCMEKESENNKRLAASVGWPTPASEWENVSSGVTVWILNQSNMWLVLLLTARCPWLTARRTWKWQGAGEVTGEGGAEESRGASVCPLVSREMESLPHLTSLLLSSLSCVTS